MKYITRAMTGIKVVDHEVSYIEKGLIQYVNELCMRELSTYRGRIESVKHTLNIYQNIPIYVHHRLLLIPTKSIRVMDMMYINYHRLIGIQKHNQYCVAVFDDDSILNINVPFSKMQKQIQKVETLLAYVNS